MLRSESEAFSLWTLVARCVRCDCYRWFAGAVEGLVLDDFDGALVCDLVVFGLGVGVRGGSVQVLRVFFGDAAFHGRVGELGDLVSGRDVQLGRG